MQTCEKSGGEELLAIWKLKLIPFQKSVSKPAIPKRWVKHR